MLSSKFVTSAKASGSNEEDWSTSAELALDTARSALNAADAGGAVTFEGESRSPLLRLFPRSR